MSHATSIRRLTRAMFAAALMILWAGHAAVAVNRVAVETKAVEELATGVTVGISLTNDLPIGAMKIPLEIREVSNGAFPVGPIIFHVQGRVAASRLMDFTSLLYFKTPSGPGPDACSGPVSSTWGGGSPSPNADGSPDAVMWLGSRLSGELLAAGADPPGEPSFFLSFDVGPALGTFEIDTMCAIPSNHLELFDAFGDPVNLEFVRGAVIVTNATNLPPIIDPVAPVQMFLGDTYFIPLQAVDPDGDTLVWDALGLPPGASLLDNGNNTADFTFHAKSTALGPHTISIIASDGALADTVVLSINVGIKDSIIVESRKVALGATNATVRVRLTNPEVLLYGLNIPLEFLPNSSGAFITAVGLSYAERLAGVSPLEIREGLRFADTSSDCVITTRPGFSGPWESILGLPPQPVVAAPEGVVFKALTTSIPLSPGSDTLGSLLLTIDVGTTPGSFDILETCIDSIGELRLHDSDGEYRPFFIPGTITVNAPPIARDTCGEVAVGGEIEVHLPVSDADNPPADLTYILNAGPAAGGTTVSFDPATGVYRYKAPLTVTRDSILFSATDGLNTSAVKRFCFEVVPSASDTLWVSTTGDDLACDGSETCPFRTITKAMATATPNPSVVIMVQPGTYSEPTIHFPTSKTTTLKSVAGPFETILSGDGTGGLGPIVVMSALTASTSQTLDGFTIAGNTLVFGSCSVCPGGVQVVSPTTARIVNNVIAGNQGTSAGGLEYGGADGLIANNWFIGNTLATIVAAGAQAAEPGAGVTIQGTGGVRFLNNTIAGNATPFAGQVAGVSIASESSVSIFDNNVIAFNDLGDGFRSDLVITAKQFRNNLYYGNGDADTVPPTILAPTPGWLFADPVFRDRISANYRLACASPAREAGYNTSYNALPAALRDLIRRDIDGQPRIFSNGTIDIGADEFVDDMKIARFTPSARAGCAPLTVHFINESECLRERFEWDFGDNTGSPDADPPPHTYTEPGAYVVELVAIGDFDTVSTTDTIRVAPPFLNPGFTATRESGCANLTVTFEPSPLDLALADAIFWEFGDGASSTAETAVHTYTQAGLYSVSMTMMNACDTVKVTRVGLIQVLSKPSGTVKTSFDAVTTPVCNPYTVDFRFETTDPIDSVLWDFGDNTRSTELEPSHTYLQGKPTGYSVQFIAYGACGQTEVVLLQKIKLNTRPSVVLSAHSTNPDTLFGCVLRDTVYFTAQITGQTTVPIWRFGDGLEDVGVSVWHVYDQINAYTPEVIVSHDCGTDTIRLTDNVVIGASPVAGFTVSADSVYQPDPVQFTDASTSQPRVWVWRFGDGDSALTPSPAHRYAPGTYNIALAVSNACGADTAAYTGIRVGGFAPMYVDSLASVGDTIVFAVEVDTMVMPYDHPVTLSGSLQPFPRRGAMKFAFDPVGGTPPFTATMRAIRSRDLASGNYSIILTATDSLRFDAAQKPYKKSVARPWLYRAPGFLTIDPTRLQMGKTAVGLPVSKSLTITNTTTKDTVVVQVPLISGDGFSIVGNGKILGPGATLIWTVQFAPPRPGTFTGQIRLRSTDPAAADSLIPVDGLAVAELSLPVAQITQPAEGAELRLDKPLRIGFNEPMKVIPVDTLLSVRSWRGDSLISGTRAFSGKTAIVFTPSAWLSPDDSLIVRLTAAVTDTSGNRLDGNQNGKDDGIGADDFHARIPVGPGVYPGDTDNDGFINERDILPIGRFYESTGSPRDDDGTQLSLKPADPWVPRSATYADADGDGAVDSMDICPVAEFFELPIGRAKTHLETFFADAGKLSNSAVSAMLAALDHCPAQGAGQSILREVLTQLQTTTRRPANYRLDQNFPNPFNPTTVISYALPTASTVRLTVYDVTGRQVRVLEDSFKPAGRHWVFWDGVNTDGIRVASGIYFYRLVTPGFDDTRKMVLLK